MKSMIKVLGIIVLATVIGIPVMAQPAPTNEAIQILQPLPNEVGNLLQKSIESAGRHFYRVNNLTSQSYYVIWRDKDNSRNLRSPYSDIRVSVLNLKKNSVITILADTETSLNKENLVNVIEINRGVHYNRGDDILIIIEALFDSGGNYALLVY